MVVLLFPLIRLILLIIQISGSFAVAKGVLGEIASRLRERCLRDAKGGAEPGPVGPGSGFGPPGNLHGGRPPPFGDIRASSSGGYGNLKVHSIIISLWAYLFS